MITSIIQRNLTDIHDCMASACARSGRNAADATLVAVTKYAEWDWVQALAVMHRVFGENRPQQLAERQPLLPEAQWHLIGQLQRNKVRQAVTHADLIHSVDSIRLLQRIADVSTPLMRRPKVLLQVNVSGEATKSGFSVESLRQEWASVLMCAAQVEVQGFMTMAPAHDDPEAARPDFRQLALLRSELADRQDTQAAGLVLPELSMGMSGDFEVAIEEGATLIRVGSRLFQGLSTPVG